jgi:hypothetical protein
MLLIAHYLSKDLANILPTDLGPQQPVNIAERVLTIAKVIVSSL